MISQVTSALTRAILVALLVATPSLLLPATAADTAQVDMTFTSMGCPCMEYITFDIRERLLQEPNINQVDLQIVWDPPWTSKQLTAKGREQLKKWGVAA